MDDVARLLRLAGSELKAAERRTTMARRLIAQAAEIAESTDTSNREDTEHDDQRARPAVAR